MIRAAELTIFCYPQRLTIKIIVPAWKAQQERQKSVVIRASMNLKWTTKGNYFGWQISITTQLDFLFKIGFYYNS